MLFCVGLAGVFGVITGVRSVTSRRVSVMSCFLVDTAFVVLCSLTVVTRGFLVMF
jgi:hypothetical protein